MTDAIIRLHFANLGSGIGEFAVQYAQYGYKATHVDYAMENDTQFLGSLFPDGVHIYGRYNPDWEAYVDLPCTDDQKAAFEDFLNKQIGKPYDTVDLLANFAIQRDWRNPNQWWCSELIAASLETVKWFGPLATGVQKVTPRDVVMAISAKGVSVAF